MVAVPVRPRKLFVSIDPVRVFWWYVPVFCVTVSPVLVTVFPESVTPVLVWVKAVVSERVMLSSLRVRSLGVKVSVSVELVEKEPPEYVGELDVDTLIVPLPVTVSLPEALGVLVWLRLPLEVRL